MSVMNTRGLCRFCPVSWAFTHRFAVPKRFPWLLNPKVLLRVGHLQSRFWPILTRFVDYYSPFWCPDAISMVVEPQGALTCRPSTIAVLADSGPFRGLLLAVLGSRVISTIDEPRGVSTCRSSTLTVLAESSLLHGLLLTVLWSRSDFHD